MGSILPIALGVLSLALVVAIVGGYRYRWTWTSLSHQVNARRDDEGVIRGKTLWNWMQLLLVSAILAAGAFLLETSQSSREQEREEERAETDRAIATDAQREQALQQYLDAMSELMLDRQLRTSKIQAEVRTVARTRTRTLTVLRRLDGERKAVVLQFLHEAGLIGRHPIVALSGADLTNADLTDADLEGADLFLADLTDAELEGTDLEGTDLSGAYLSGADFSQASLIDADLTDADLSGASFRGAVASGETVWPNQFDPKAAGVAVLNP